MSRRMRRRGMRALSGVVAVVALWASPAQAAEPTEWPKWMRQLAKPSELMGRMLETDVPTGLIPSILPTAKPAPPVPPAWEIEVLDPNADPLGNPAIELKRRERDPYCGLACDEGGRPGCDQLLVDIPPVVIVHRYYYTGDRSFQGPMLPGGPSIVVVHHPKTGQRCYIPVQMLPGAPVVHYKGSGIEYDYGTHGITLTFGHFTGRPKVVYRNHVPLTRQAKKAYEGAKQGAGKLLQETRLPELADATAEGAKSFVSNLRNGAEDGTEMLFGPAISLFKATPLGSLFASNPEEQAQRRRDREVQAAARKLRSQGFYPTVR